MDKALVVLLFLCWLFMLLRAVHSVPTDLGQKTWEDSSDADHHDNP